MTYVAAMTDKFPSGEGIAFSGRIVSDKIAGVVVVFAVAAGMAAWIAGLACVLWITNPASLKESYNKESYTVSSYAPSSDAGFLQRWAPSSSSMDLGPSRLVRSMRSELETKVEQAKGMLAQKLRVQDVHPEVQVAATDEPAPSAAAAVPLPRSRPVEANLESKNGVAAAQPDNRTLLQKLSALFPAPIELASLGSDGGLFRSGPDLTSLGYDSTTAVYDISARAVYLPNGAKLEAHSGYGNLMDDPGHVNERMVGATPPNVYELKPRERLFHGVQALRMIPVGDGDMLGRSGLLTHSFMLGPNGDSNGCVSIRDYDKFLAAFNNGEIKRLVVVPSLGEAVTASRRSSSPS
jgi:type VI secretion system (T6SS) effector TldE1-like protein